MNKGLKNNLSGRFKTKARVLDSKIVEVIAPDGEVFHVLCQIGKYISEEIRRYELHVIETIFDENYSDDKEVMLNNVWRDAILNGLSFMGMSSGDRQQERLRIGNRIRQIRGERCMEARDLAKLAGIDAANLSRIEKGKYSVGLDILSKIAAVFGKKIDFVEL